MKPFTRDILVGVVAGLAAVVVLSARRERLQIPPGLYQASLDLPQHREMAQMLRPPASSAATVQRLQKRLDAPDVKGAALDQVLAYLADASGVEIHVDWAVLAGLGIARNAGVDVRLNGVTVAEALRQALAAPAAEAPESHRLTYQIEGDRLRVSTYEEFSSETITRVYDVREIIRLMLEIDRGLLPPARPPRAEPKPPVNRGHLEPWPPTEFVTSPPQAVEFLRETIVSMFDPVSWLENGGNRGRVHYIAGRLIVTQTRPTQDQIAVWLQFLNEELRNPTPRN